MGFPSLPTSLDKRSPSRSRAMKRELWELSGPPARARSGVNFVNFVGFAR